MKFKYEFESKESVEIEVDDYYGEILIELDRKEYNNNHKETRRHSSYSFENDKAYIFKDKSVDVAAELESDIVIEKIMSCLTKDQQYIMKKVFIDGYSQIEIAKELGIAKSSMAERIKRIKEKIKRILTDPEL